MVRVRLSHMDMRSASPVSGLVMCATYVAEQAVRWHYAPDFPTYTEY